MTQAVYINLYKNQEIMLTYVEINVTGITHSVRLLQVDSQQCITFYIVSKKLAPIYFCNNFVKPSSILKIFGNRVFQ